MRHGAFLLLLAAAGSGCRAKAAPPESGSASMARAARFLWSRQGEDGGWHSETYGLLRSGQSLTPFVLAALLEVPGEVAPPPAWAIEQALAFLKKSVDAEGALGRSDPMVEDYPTYATSLGIRAMALARKREALQPMTAFLERQQFSEETGWMPDHPAYGAWGMGGAPRRPPHTGHVDLSMTRHALEALATAGLKPTDGTLVRSAKYLARCQNPDGGFVFSTVIVDANKAGSDGDRYRSYGTATADGILALLATGAPTSDSRVKAAEGWLKDRHRVDRVPGFPVDFPKDWSGGMIYYYLAISARTFQALDVQEAPRGQDWRKGIRTALMARQQADGSFRNPTVLMKEDDPLIATPLALTALVASSTR